MSATRDPLLPSVTQLDDLELLLRAVEVERRPLAKRSPHIDAARNDECSDD